MTTPVTPLNIKRAIDTRKEAEQSNPEMDKLIEAIDSKYNADESNRHAEAAEKRKALRKAANALKREGMLVDEIALQLGITVFYAKKLTTPVEQKPHLTQRIQGLEALRKRNGGK